jgi:CYTH domain
MEVYKREVERKYVITNKNYNQAYYNLFDISDTVTKGDSHDSYWRAPNVDFIRLRENSKELTVKVTDKETIIDRIEENVKVEDLATADRLLTLLYGPPCLRLRKEFSVFDIEIMPVPGTLYPAILCLYQVVGDKKNRVFFEIEAETIQIVDEVYKTIHKMFTLEPESKSLFQLFVGGTK